MNEAELWECSPEGYLTRRMSPERITEYRIAELERRVAELERKVEK